MTQKKVTILDGTRLNDSIATGLSDLILEKYQREGYSVNNHKMESIKLANCIGCFGCWVKSPGECVSADRGRDIAREIINSHTLVLLSPVVFGGYSAALKYMVDRFLPLILPYMAMLYGEIHHHPRYSRFPRMVGIGLQEEYDENSVFVFRTMVGRNAINFHCPSHAAEVIQRSQSSEIFKNKLEEVFTRHDPVPKKPILNTMMSRLIPKETSRARSGGARHALLIIGSPKTGASNSEILGNYLLGQLHEKGWETHTVKLRPRIFNDEGLKELLSEVNNCNLIVLAAPLYIDSLPAMVVKVFEKLVENRGELIKLETKRLFAIVNNGFPEAYQNAIALEICQNFAQKMGMIWAGGLALGAGEAVVREQPLTEQKRSGPPVLHVIEALNTTAVMLDQDGQISSGPTRIFVKSPIPMVPFPLWRWMYIFLAASDFKKRAATHGIQKHQLKIKPYAA